MLDTVLFARDKWLAPDGKGKTRVDYSQPLCLSFQFTTATVIFCELYKMYLFSVYPDRCTMSVVGVEDKKRVEDKITFWEDVYGILISFRFSLLLWSLRCLPYHIY
jgi:hypothetical protein